MAMKISYNDFEGPFLIDSNETNILSGRAAVYAILRKSSDNKYYLVDVGESGEIEMNLANHDRRACWDKKCGGSPLIYLCYMPSSEGYKAADRRALERNIREEYNPVCGRE